ncbi:MAG: Uma2 family endonuclease [Polyangiaceae bacterium]
MPPPPDLAHAAGGPRRRNPKELLPDVDERLVMPETRFEAIDGEIVYVAPADEAHGTLHAKLAALLGAHAAAGYTVAADMLTRTSAKSDFAPDASVFPSARNPETGGRQLEELAFEIVSTERLSHAAKKARELSKRGVRRIFAIDVERRRALEWFTATDAWEILSNDAPITDRALAVPLPLRAVVEAAETDDTVAAALLAKKNPVIATVVQDSSSKAEARGHQQGKVEGKVEGKIEGKIESLLAILSARGLAVTAKDEKKIRAAKDNAVLDRWIRRAVTAASAGEILRK